VSRLQQHGCAVRPFDEDRVSPADVDVVDLQVLTERDSSRKQRRHNDPEHEAHPANTHIRASNDLCGGRSLRIAGNLTPDLSFRLLRPRVKRIRRERFYTWFISWRLVQLSGLMRQGSRIVCWAKTAMANAPSIGAQYSP